MKVRSVLGVLAASLMLACYSSGGARGFSHNPCAGGGHGQQGPEGHPTVCIDRALFDLPQYHPDPDPIEANHGVRMDFWFSDDQGDLEIQFTADTPVYHQRCDGPHCWAVVRPDVPPHQNIRRKYSIIDRSNGRHADPEVIIEP